MRIRKDIEIYHWKIFIYLFETGSSTAATIYLMDHSINRSDVCIRYKKGNAISEYYQKYRIIVHSYTLLKKIQLFLKQNYKPYQQKLKTETEAIFANYFSDKKGLLYWSITLLVEQPGTLLQTNSNGLDS